MEGAEEERLLACVARLDECRSIGEARNLCCVGASDQPTDRGACAVCADEDAACGGSAIFEACGDGGVGRGGGV